MLPLIRSSHSRKAMWNTCFHRLAAVLGIWAMLGLLLLVLDDTLRGLVLLLLFSSFWVLVLALRTERTNPPRSPLQSPTSEPQSHPQVWQVEPSEDGVELLNAVMEDQLTRRLSPPELPTCAPTE